ncbi:hypothetical protein [Phenylobacterium deserti]|uniref:Uncharacterized protein n=1 Tax=Phenylobacterium deserti TaxID=1914756 RepID=A0A328ATT4_9CAUL|nr:hypothetical protein [Phenylobacterium deserti]RAK58017.1 hypothetical protein DJ018_08945 [Phenylobacterium deserti]
MTDPSPHPAHLDERDPAKADVRDIREEADRELEHYQAQGRKDLVLLIPEDRWDEFVQLTGGQASGDETTYREVTFKKAAVTAVIAQDGF